MTILDQVMRWLRKQNWLRERRRRQKALEQTMPKLVIRGQKIALARRSHKRCKELIEANRAEMHEAMGLKLKG